MVNVHHDLGHGGEILTSLVAGGVAGGLANTTIAPLERSKIFFQTNETRDYRLRHALSWLRHRYQAEGLLSLWRGNTAMLARIVPCSAIYFMTYEQYKRLLGVTAGTPGPASFVAGSLAGSTGQLVTYPLDRARAVMAVTNMSGAGRQYGNLVAVFSSIYREEGLLSLYRGLSPTLLGVIPYAGTSFFTYEALKDWAVRRRGSSMNTSPVPPSPVEKLGCGAVAGLLGQAASYPMDVVR